MNPTTRTKQGTRISFSIRKMRQFVRSPVPSLPHTQSLTILFQFRSIHKKSVKSSRHRSTVPDAVLPPSASVATVAPVRDLEDGTDVMQGTQTSHDIVLKSKM